MGMNRKTTIDVLDDGTVIRIDELQRTPPWQSKYPAMKEWTKATRVYIDPAGETILQNLMHGRWNRPVKAYKPIALKALKRIGLDGHNVHWSQRAGCSCGCSPGFVLRTKDNEHVISHRADDNVTPIDIFIKVYGNIGEGILRALTVGLT